MTGKKSFLNAFLTPVLQRNWEIQENQTKYSENIVLWHGMIGYNTKRLDSKLSIGQVRKTVIYNFLRKFK